MYFDFSSCAFGIRSNFRKAMSKTSQSIDNQDDWL